jgi:3-hydroxybutyryl-CoA dehydratase
MNSTPADHPPIVHALSQQVVDLYAELSGDFNPIHVDAEYAAKTPFGRTVAHGPLVLQSFFDALLTWLDADALPPGVRVQAVFRNPTMSDATVSCQLLGVEVENDLATLRAECRTDGSTVAVSVTASVPVPPGSRERAALLAAGPP